MTAIFGNLSNDGLEETQDRLGGFKVYDSDAYLVTIKLAYATKSNTEGSKAQGVVITADINGADYTETFWMTDKEGNNFFRNKQDPTKKIPLPGYATIDEICLVTCEKNINQMAAEEKVVNIYDFEHRKELPKSVMMLTELLGKQLYFGIIKEKTIKQKRNESSGEFEDTNETREQNVVDKVFHNPTKLTIPEARAGKTTGEFFDGWVKKWKGNIRDRTAKKGAPASGGTPPQANSGQSAQGSTSSLFKKS